jgi:DNA polymerase III subunit gamma/tau
VGETLDCMTEDSATRVPVQPSAPYRVLARKYRPVGFDGLIGQQAMVRTLVNAFRSGRLAHAYMLAGVRGIGKTTTARIIARAFNCIGPDGGGGPTASPCGVCENCRAIAEDRHVDVREVDAASHTGVDQIRELIDGARYLPAMARFKVYVIDEVHMLSRSAFNALLKTLEEPPEHVRFVFATTEVRKVPVTVLSRCQRFDLKRIDSETLVSHFADIAAQEHVRIAPPALQLIARAADGSVRDGLSLLDQAIAHAQGDVGEDTVRQMLGLADRTVVFDLFHAEMRGDIKTALDLIGEQYAAGADPAVVLEDLLELTHWLTRIKITPAAGDAPGVPEAERVRGKELAGGLGMAELTRAWQILLKGLGETRSAPVPIQAAEMTLVRLGYAARLPTPAEAIKAWQAEANGGDIDAQPHPGQGAGTRQNSGPAVGQRAGHGEGRPSPHSSAGRERDGVPTAPVSSSPSSSFPGPQAARSAARMAPQGAVAAAVAPNSADPVPSAAGEADDWRDPESFEAVVALVAAHREGLLQAKLMSAVHLVHFEPGRIEMRLAESAPDDLPRQLSRFLNENTSRRWLVTVSRSEGEATLVEQREAADAAHVARATRHPLVQAVLDAFPGATIAAVRDLEVPLEPADDDEAEEEV